MRRILFLLLAAVVGLVGIVQVAPVDAPTPDFGDLDITEGDGVVASPSVWYCPWVEAGDIADTNLMVASDVDTDVSVTLLDPISNTEPVEFTFDVVGPGAASIDAGSIARRGESPATVEISDGPAAVGTLQRADGFVSGDRCVVSVPKIWYLTGGATKTGTFTEIRLFNPFADHAEVTVTAYSEFGLDLIADLQDISVAGRSWTTIDLEPFLPFRDELAFKIETTAGLVIPALIRTDAAGEAMWLGTAPSETWEFPIATAGGLEPFIAVMSVEDDDVTVTVDIVTETGTIVSAREVVVGASTPALIPLSDIAAPPYGARVRASGLIAASVFAAVPEIQEDVEGMDDEGDETLTTTPSDDPDAVSLFDEATFVRGLAGMAGLRSGASKWIVPLDTLLDSLTTVWIMNPGDQPAGVTVVTLSEGEVTPVVITVEPGTIQAFPIDVGIGIYGLSIESDTPVSVAWEIAGDRGVALSAGVGGE